MKIIEKLNEENLKKLIKESTTLAEILRGLNDKPTGGNYLRLKRKIEEYKIDISHFNGQAFNKGDRYRPFYKERSLEDILVEKSTYTNTTSLKNKLYKYDLKKPICEECGQDENWRGKKFSLIIDHVNGIGDDNRIENLRILCPNCNATLDTHCRGSKIYNIKPDKEKYKFKYKQSLSEKNLCECGEIKSSGAQRCRKCSDKNKEKVIKPDIELLKIEVKELGYSATGRKYNVSDNTIRKWIRNK